MRHSVPTRLLIGAAFAASAALLPGCSVPTKPAEAPPAASTDDSRNFGFPLGFSPSKMDTAADPRQDFRRYAGGRWLDAANIPSDQLEISGYLVMQETVANQLRDLLQEAARMSDAAPKGSPTQQIGDFYASGMDVDRLKALGVQPLAPEFDRIAKVQGRTALAEELGRLQLTGNGAILAAIIAPHPKDRDRMTIYVGDATLGLGVDNYLNPDAQRIRDGYVAKMTDYLVIGGWQPEAARATAQKVLALETRVAKKKLTPLEKRDPAKRFVPMPYADAQRLLSNIDLDAFFRSLGLPTGGEVVVVEVEALRERNAILAEWSPEDTRAYLQFELLPLKKQLHKVVFIIQSRPQLYKNLSIDRMPSRIVDNNGRIIKKRLDFFSKSYLNRLTYFCETNMLSLLGMIIFSNFGKSIWHGNCFGVAIVVAISFLCCWTSGARAAGFALVQQGTAAMGQGNAFVAEANDASAIFYNPAGLNQIKRAQVYQGSFFNYPDGSLAAAARTLKPIIEYTGA